MVSGQSHSADISELEKLEPLIRQSLRSGPKRLRFPEEIERVYRRFVLPSRRRRYLTLAAIALVIYNLFCISDWFILRDIFDFAWKVRLLAVTPVMLAGMLLATRKISPRQLDWVASSLVLLSLASICLFMVVSRQPQAVHYYSGISVILMFSNMIIRLPFSYALSVSSIACILYLLSVRHMAMMTAEAVFSSVIIIFTSALFSLAGNYQMGYEHRRDFLLSVLQQIAGRKMARLNARLESLSLTDGLTGLANRRQFDTILAREWHTAMRNQYPLALVFLDVDHFKDYNDHYGHQAGDVCLQRIGAALANLSKRAQDLPARYGGEEFVVLLPFTDLQHARMLAEAIRREVAALAIPHAYSRAAPVLTVSLGVAAMLPNSRQACGDLVNLADQALYRAKAGGRNRVEVGGLPVAGPS